MAKRERDKGLRGEREVRHAFEQHGFEVRGLEGSGDHLIVRDQTSSRDLHLEVKRQERVALPLWLRQAAAEAPPGTIPIVCFRQNHGRWHVALPLDDLLEVLQ